MAQYEAFLQALLSPLGVYDLSEGSASGSELFALGAGLDAVSEKLESAEREALTMTAQDAGLARREALFARAPAAPTVELRRAAIAALEQIAGDSLTLSAINQTIRGCGILAEARELGGGRIRVLFPDTAGEPADFTRIRRIILDIVPCHLETEFYFRFLTFAECEARGLTWEYAESRQHTWESFQKDV
jgi:hypothetical protein